MSRALSRAGAALLAAAVLLAGCSGPPMPTPTPTASPTPTGDGVLRIGTLFSLSGPLAGYGAGQTAAVNAAVRELNASGGVQGAPVEVVNRDGGDVATVEAAFDALVAKGVDVVIGPVVVGGRGSAPPARGDGGRAAGVAVGERDHADGRGRRMVLPHHPDAGRAGLGARRAAGRRRDDAGRPHRGRRRCHRGPRAGSRARPHHLPRASFVADVRTDPTAVAADPAAAAAASVDEATADDPDVVVLATADDGSVTPALVAALAAAGYGGEQALARRTQSHRHLRHPRRPARRCEGRRRRVRARPGARGPVPARGPRRRVAAVRGGGVRRHDPGRARGHARRRRRRRIDRPHASCGLGRRHPVQLVRRVPRRAHHAAGHRLRRASPGRSTSARTASSRCPASACTPMGRTTPRRSPNGPSGSFSGLL